MKKRKKLENHICTMCWHLRLSIKDGKKKYYFKKQIEVAYKLLNIKP